MILLLDAVSNSHALVSTRARSADCGQEYEEKLKRDWSWMELANFIPFKLLLVIASLAEVPSQLRCVCFVCNEFKSRTDH